MFFNNCRRHKCECKIQQHVHDVAGFTALAGGRCNTHKHCFEGVVGRAIPCGNSHVHEVCIVTDINDCHCHKIVGRTGPAIQTDCGHHIHIIEGFTTCNDGHKHCVKVATGTEKPILCDR